MNDSGEASSGLGNRPPGLAPELRQLQDAGDVDRRWWETEDSSKPSVRPAASTETDADQPPGWGFGPPPPPPAPSLTPDRIRAAGPPPQQAAAPEPATTKGSPLIPEWQTHGAAAAQTDGCTDTVASTTPATQAIATTQAAGAAQAQAQAQADALAMQRLELELAAARAEAAALHEMLEDLPEIFERKFRQRLQSILEQQQRLLADNQALREQVHTLTPAAAPAVETRPSRLLLPASQPSSLGETLRKVLRLGRPSPPEAIDPDRFG